LIFFLISNRIIIKSDKRNSSIHGLYRRKHLCRRREKNKKLWKLSSQGATNTGYTAVQVKRVKKKNKKDSSSIDDLLRFSKLLSFLSIQKHYKRQECTIFHTRNQTKNKQKCKATPLKQEGLTAWGGSQHKQQHTLKRAN
jgi:hypothetical protein